MTGHLYVFINRRGDVAQILFWDRTGFVVMRKRLEAGTFRLIRQADGVAKHLEIDGRGVEPDVGRDRPWRRQSGASAIGTSHSRRSDSEEFYSRLAIVVAQSATVVH